MAATLGVLVLLGGAAALDGLDGALADVATASSAAPVCVLVVAAGTFDAAGLAQTLPAGLRHHVLEPAADGSDDAALQGRLRMDPALAPLLRCHFASAAVYQAARIDSAALPDLIVAAIAAPPPPPLPLYASADDSELPVGGVLVFCDASPFCRDYVATVAAPACDQWHPRVDCFLVDIMEHWPLARELGVSTVPAILHVPASPDAAPTVSTKVATAAALHRFFWLQLSRCAAVLPDSAGLPAEALLTVFASPLDDVSLDLMRLMDAAEHRLPCFFAEYPATADWVAAQGLLAAGDAGPGDLPLLFVSDRAGAIQCAPRNATESAAAFDEFLHEALRVVSAEVDPSRYAFAMGWFSEDDLAREQAVPGVSGMPAAPTLSAPHEPFPLGVATWDAVMGARDKALLLLFVRDDCAHCDRVRSVLLGEGAHDHRSEHDVEFAIVNCSEEPSLCSLLPTQPALALVPPPPQPVPVTFVFEVYHGPYLAHSIRNWILTHLDPSADLLEGLGIPYLEVTLPQGDSSRELPAHTRDLSWRLFGVVPLVVTRSTGVQRAMLEFVRPGELRFPIPTDKSTDFMVPVIMRNMRPYLGEMRPDSFYMPAYRYLDDMPVFLLALPGSWLPADHCKEQARLVAQQLYDRMAFLWLDEALFRPFLSQLHPINTSDAAEDAAEHSAKAAQGATQGRVVMLESVTEHRAAFLPLANPDACDFQSFHRFAVEYLEAPARFLEDTHLSALS